METLKILLCWHLLKNIFVRSDVLSAARVTTIFEVSTSCRLMGKPTLRIKALSSSSSLKMETTCFSKTLVSTYESRWRYSLEKRNYSKSRICFSPLLHCLRGAGGGRTAVKNLPSVNDRLCPWVLHCSAWGFELRLTGGNSSGIACISLSTGLGLAASNPPL